MPKPSAEAGRTFLQVYGLAPRGRGRFSSKGTVMGDDKDWQKQLMTAALMAAARTAVQYITNPNSRDEAVEDVKSKLAEVDYSSAAKAVSEVIDRVADSAKSALNEAIDSIRENAEDAVEMAAEKAQEQLAGQGRKRGKGRMMFGILLGIALGFVLLNEDRRNQLMDKVTGASGPIDGSQWSTVASATKPEAAVTGSVESAAPAEPAVSTADNAADVTQVVETVPEAASTPPAEAPASDTDNGAGTKTSSRKAKGTQEGAKSDA